ncbi:MAG: DNA-binding response regulator [Vagococcus sp.]|uniref:response regulator transcription factor n=1 Tax=Vagococcus TaxID=2737 RepID=UPI002FCC490F
MCYVQIATPFEKDRLFIKKIIRQDFFNITLLEDAYSTEDVLQTANKEIINILILSLAKEMKEPFRYKTEVLQKQPNTKVILIDTEKNFDNLQKSIRCGAIDYLVAPLDEKELQQSIHRSILSLNQISLLHYSTTQITDNRSEQINQIIQYIHLNFKDEISLDTLANFSHMHRNYVSRLFKEATGMSFTEYLTFYRIEQGKKCLVSTDDSISLVSEDVGYADPAYFSRIFKKETGYTPNQYRQQFTSSYVPADTDFALT